MAFENIFWPKEKENRTYRNCNSSVKEGEGIREGTKPKGERKNLNHDNAGLTNLGREYPRIAN